MKNRPSLKKTEIPLPRRPGKLNLSSISRQTDTVARSLFVYARTLFSIVFARSLRFSNHLTPILLNRSPTHFDQM